MLLSGISRDALQPLGFPAVERAGCVLSGASCPYRASRAHGSEEALLKGSQDHFSCCSLKPVILCTLWGKVPHAEKAAAGFSRCQQPLLPCATNLLCTCAQVPVPLLSAWAGFTVCLPHSKKSGISVQSSGDSFEIVSPGFDPQNSSHLRLTLVSEKCFIYL